MLADTDEFTRDVWEKAIPRRCLVSRDQTILELARGRDVLHLGATDSPFTREKAHLGELLHQKVRAVAASVVGVDQDADAITWLDQTQGIRDIVLGDVMDPSLLSGQRFDVVLCCDVIEHVSNPGDLLDAAQAFLKDGALLVVTTVNATALKVALRALFGREAVHPEHTCYFSYATLCETLLRHGLTPRRFGTFCYPTRLRVSAWFFDGLASLAPGSADGLIVVAQRVSA